MDVCVTVNVKLIFHEPQDDDLSEALQRNETILTAQQAGACREADIAAEIKAKLLEQNR